MTTFIKWLNNRFLLVALLLAGTVTNLIILGRAYDLSKSDWASWVQAVGSIAAISFAYVVGLKQANSTLQSVQNADKIAANRKFTSMLAVADAAKSYSTEIGKAFPGNTASYFGITIQFSEEQMRNLMSALQVIPAHELGSFVERGKLF